MLLPHNMPSQLPLHSRLKGAPARRNGANSDAALLLHMTVNWLLRVSLAVFLPCIPCPISPLSPQVNNTPPKAFPTVPREGFKTIMWIALAATFVALVMIGFVVYVFVRPLRTKACRT